MAQEATTKIVTHKDVNYVIAENPFEDLDVMEAFEDQKYATLVRLLLGPKQWATYKQTRRTTSETLELAAALLGVEADEE